MFKSLFQILPSFLKKMIRSCIFAFKSPKLLETSKQYKYSDEQLKFVHILECINYLKVAGYKNNLPQVYFEFGCHSGRTFSSAVNAANYLGLEEANFFAFDSFKGLPKTKENEDGIFQEGEYSTGVQEFKRIVKKNTGLILNNENIIEGFYSDSLSDSLQAKMPKVGIVHIDVDLYSSTVDVLKFIKPLIVKGSILIFDDWYCFPAGEAKGERLALEEFLLENDEFSVEEWKSYSTFGKSFFITSIKG